ncbi:MAG: hypothetical protein J6J17_00485 [Bacilli bacterium]|nr:hypothetical protein [Bacilli bacterium]
MIVYHFDINDCLKKNSQKQVFKKLQSNLFNTFNYDKGKEYIHFFRYKSFIQQFFDDDNGESIILSADIPDELLEKCKGFGFYIIENQEMPIPEYAVPLEEFNENCVIGVEKIQEANIEFEDLNQYKKYLETIKKLKSNGMDVPSITVNLLNSSVCSLIENVQTENKRK